MTLGRLGLVVLPLLAACGPAPVTSSLQRANCERAAQIAVTGVPARELQLGPVRPPLPDGIEDPRGVILEPQSQPTTLGPDAPTLDAPDPERRKMVIVGGTDLDAPALRLQFDDALARVGLHASGDKQEVKVGGKLSEFAFSFAGPQVDGTARFLPCRPSSLVVVSQTLVS